MFKVRVAVIINHFLCYFPFWFRWKHWKIFGFLMFSGGQEERSGLNFFFYVLVTTNFSEVVCKVEYAFFQSSCSAILVNSCLVYVAFFWYCYTYQVFVSHMQRRGFNCLGFCAMGVKVKRWKILVFFM